MKTRSLRLEIKGDEQTRTSEPRSKPRKAQPLALRATLPMKRARLVASHKALARARMRLQTGPRLLLVSRHPLRRKKQECLLSQVKASAVVAAVAAEIAVTKAVVEARQPLTVPRVTATILASLLGIILVRAPPLWQALTTR